LKQNEITFLVVALILAAVVGGVVGDIVGFYLPQGQVKTLFTQHYQKIGFEPTTFNLYAISFTLGFRFKINFVSILFIILVIVYFKWWYL